MEDIDNYFRTETVEYRREIKFCQHCGARIDARAEICPKCGVRVEKASIYTIKKNAGLAAVLSFFIFGLGQIYNGEISKGIKFVVLGYIVLPFSIGLLNAMGLGIIRVGYDIIGIGVRLIGPILLVIFWIYNIRDAYSTAEKINAGKQ